MSTNQFDPTNFNRTIVPLPPDPHSAKQALNDYRIMLVTILTAILDRYDRCPDYHFIDTKLSLFSGTDFSEKDAIRGPTAIYGWIQGRGIEALAGHHAWLQNSHNIDKDLSTSLCKRIENILKQVVTQLESNRQSNSGRFSFLMNTKGQSLKINPDSTVTINRIPINTPSNVSEMFYVKGLAAAAHVLNDDATLDIARQWYDIIHNDIEKGQFASDQQSLDPKNTALGIVSGRQGHGARMIGLGAATRFLQCTQDTTYRDRGFTYLDYILENHVNTTADNDLTRQYDMWEFTNNQNQPFVNEDGSLLSDPGHATEFVGLALRFLAVCEELDLLADLDKTRFEKYNHILPRILKRNFKNGFSEKGYGIVKAFNLITHKPTNSDMPWWSLPETMRAALGAFRVVPPHERAEYAQIAVKCSNAFLKYYVRTDLHLMAYQTINADSQPIDVIPATPDADPGYHTGLSIIDCLNIAENPDIFNA